MKITQVPYLLLLIAFLISCTQQDSTAKEVDAYKKSLRLLRKQSKRVLNQMEYRAKESPSAKDYQTLAKQLNDLVNANLDTLFLADYKDTMAMKIKMEAFSKKRTRLLDSFMNSHPPRKYFLSQDSAYLKSLTYNPVFASVTNSKFNQYLTMQNLLFNHAEEIHLLTGAFSSCYIRFVKMSTTNVGYMVNALENEKTTKLKFFYRFFPSNETYSMRGILKITNANGQVIPIMSQNKTKSDTLYLETKKLPKGNYSAYIGYDLITVSGDSYIETIEFPFSAW